MLWLLPAALAAPEADQLYFVLVDRFDDALPDAPGTTDRADPQAFHGGDLPGITARLDHLVSLGVTTLWISPVFSMHTDKFFEHGAFHGYWVEDLSTIEPRLGGEAALKTLAEQAHARGISLVLDMVYNHVCFDADRLDTHPDWFHPPEDITDWNDPAQLTAGRVHGLPDLDQSQDAVYHYLLGRTLHWAKTLPADGVRIDAVRHLNPDFLPRLSADLKTHLGEDFWLLGEDFQGDAAALATSFRDGGFDAMFDFPLHYAMVDVFCRDAHPGRLATTLSLDRLYDDPHSLVTFLDNHDLPRIMSACGGQRERVEAALAFQHAVRGIPALTYGTEWLLEGAGEPENRGDIPWDRPGVITDTLADLAARRRDHPALTAGTTTLLHLDADTLLLRRDAPTESALVGLNRSSAPRQLDDVLLPPGVSVQFVPPMPPPPSAPVPVTFAIQADLPPGERLVVTGSGPELGGWNPASGVELAQQDGLWQGRIALPAGAIAYKLVRIDADGAAHWESGDNRYALLSAHTHIEAEWPAR